MERLKFLSKTELLNLIHKYDQYIQEWYEYHDEGCPVCIMEFYDNEYQEEE